MDKNDIEFKYFNDFINTTTEVSNWRIQNNNHIFSIYKYTILISFGNVIALLFTDKYICILKLMLLIIMLFSWIIGLIWFKINKNYGAINGAKFNVIKNTCDELNINSYFHKEYDIYSKGIHSDITTWENLLIFSIPILITLITLIMLFSNIGGSV